MQQPSEPDLIERAKQGDQQAFRKLVELHQRFAYSVAYRIVGNSSDAEDVVPEVFIKLWRNIAKYRFEIKLTTWLYKIITNQCLDHLKSASSKQKSMNQELKFNLQVSDGIDPEKQFSDQELVEVITTLARRLTPKQQAVFVLRDLEGLSVEEVCEILDMPSGKLKSNLYYARMKIREDLTLYYKETVKWI
jgi:RNA polymerase sigma-70 factor, ECF subfamily